MGVRIDPERGGVLAAGGVLLAAAVAMIDLRLDDAWANGVHLLVALAAFVLVFGVALVSPIVERPRAYQTTLALAGLVLLVIVLDRLGRVFIDDNPFSNSGTLIWMSLVFAAVAALAALRFQSIPCALLAGLAVVVAVIAFVAKVFDPDGIGTYRWVILILILAFVAAAVFLHQGPRRGFAVQAVNVVGLLLVGLGATFVGLAAAAAAAAAFGGGSVTDVGFGWKAILVLGSLAVLAYAAVQRERGPGYIGVVAFLFAILVVARPRGEATIVGWPLLLLLAAGAAFAIGLVPRGHGTGGGGTATAPPPAGSPQVPASAPPQGPPSEPPPPPPST
jgi:hypothetical protein